MSLTQAIVCRLSPTNSRCKFAARNSGLCHLFLHAVIPRFVSELSASMKGEGRETWGQFAWKHGQRTVVIFLLVKTVMGLQNVIFPKPVVDHAPVSLKLESVYDQDSDTFSVLDRRGVSFILRPRRACSDTRLIFAVLTAPKNLEKREALRR